MTLFIGAAIDTRFSALLIPGAGMKPHYAALSGSQAFCHYLEQLASLRLYWRRTRAEKRLVRAAARIQLSRRLARTARPIDRHGTPARAVLCVPTDGRGLFAGGPGVDDGAGGLLAPPPLATTAPLARAESRPPLPGNVSGRRGCRQSGNRTSRPRNYAAGRRRRPSGGGRR